MAKRAIVVKLGPEEVSFRFQKIDRDKLYGRKERVVLDENGERCVAAMLTADGAALVPPGGAAHVYVDEDFDTVDRSALRPVDDEGRPLELVASTLGVPQELVPVTAQRVLDCRVESVYQLETDTLSEGLGAALADGDLFETVYQYRDGHAPDVLFLLQNEHGIFGLVARETGFDMLPRVLAAVPEPLADDDDEGDELDGDLDFTMF